MVVVQLRGGLGNQLFQWALARALSHEGRAVALDRRLVRWGPRRLAIGPLCTDLHVRSAPSAAIAISGFLGASRTLTGYRRIVEPHFHYWPGVFGVRGRCLLEGYWQSPRYFACVAGDIRSRVTAYCEELLTGAGRDLLTRIREDPGAVSVHVRRRDYVTHPRTAALCGFVGIDYYQRALAEMRERGARTYYIFSDDLPWVNRHLRGVDAHVVSRAATLDAGGELALMAACSGHVIANSSFSWWGAWLDPEPSLGVIAPSPWFLDETMVTDDLLLATWLRRGRGPVALR